MVSNTLTLTEQDLDELCKEDSSDDEDDEDESNQAKADQKKEALKRAHAELDNMSKAFSEFLSKKSSYEGAEYEDNSDEEEDDDSDREIDFDADGFLSALRNEPQKPKVRFDNCQSIYSNGHLFHISG